MLRLICLLASLALPAAAQDRSALLEVARQGWTYQLRTTMLGRDLSIPVRIQPRDLAGRDICVLGEVPRAATRATLDALTGLLAETFGKPIALRQAARPDACGAAPSVYLRLYSGPPPNADLTADLLWLSERYGLGLPRGRVYAAMSPAQGQAFFGREGQAVHLMVRQPHADDLSDLESAFFASILVEELFQVFTYGMDILHLDREVPFVSKLEEFPVNLYGLPWDAPRFMEGLLRSNPRGLCVFDVLMLHALARAPFIESTDAGLTGWIDTHFDELSQAARDTTARPRYAAVLDSDCQVLPD